MTKLEITIHAEELITAIIRLAVALEGQQTKGIPAPALLQPEEKETRDECPVTLEQVRALLAAKSKSGRQAQIKDLITKYGATKLTDVNPVNYSELLKEAEGL